MDKTVRRLNPLYLIVVSEWGRVFLGLVTCAKGQKRKGGFPFLYTTHDVGLSLLDVGKQTS